MPADAEVEAFVRAIRDAGVQLVGLNFFAGDLTGPDAGVLSIPDRSAQFRDNLEVSVGIGEQLGVTAFNALYGNRVDGVAPDAQDELARDNLGRAAQAAARIGATVLVEPVSGPKPYPLRTADDAVAVVDALRSAGHENVGLLCDLFHLANNGDDVEAAIARHADVTSHVQIADHPGRGEPGSGDAGSRPLPPRPRRPRLHGLGRPGVQADHRHRDEPAVVAEAAARGTRSGGTSMSTVGFIGLGIMGSPMAVHLQKAGHQVSGYNRSDRGGPLVEAGGRKASSIADAVKDADVVAIMVPDSPDVQEVLAGSGGVFESAASGTLIIDFSSIRPDVTAELAQAAKERGFRLLDAPVSGGEAGAKNAVLSIMVGGAAEDFAAAKPIFEAVGRTIVHVGPSGAGQTVKAANQLIVGVNIEALAEAVVFLEAYGVDIEAALDVLGGGLAGSKVLEQKRENMLRRSFAPGFRIDLHHKDMGIVTSAAREAGVILPVGAIAAQLMASARACGDGEPRPLGPAARRRATRRPRAGATVTRI